MRDHLADAPGCRDVLLLSWRYEDLTELTAQGYIDRDNGERRLAALDEEAVRQAVRWIREDGPGYESQYCPVGGWIR